MKAEMRRKRPNLFEREGDLPCVTLAYEGAKDDASGFMRPTGKGDTVPDDRRDSISRDMPSIIGDEYCSFGDVEPIDPVPGIPIGIISGLDKCVKCKG
jgi:hypothetical protein